MKAIQIAWILGYLILNVSLVYASPIAIKPLTQYTISFQGEISRDCNYYYCRDGVSNAVSEAVAGDSITGTLKFATNADGYIVGAYSNLYSAYYGPGFPSYYVPTELEYSLEINLGNQKWSTEAAGLDIIDNVSSHSFGNRYYEVIRITGYDNDTGLVFSAISDDMYYLSDPTQLVLRNNEERSHNYYFDFDKASFLGGKISSPHFYSFRLDYIISDYSISSGPINEVDLTTKINPYLQFLSPAYKSSQGHLEWFKLSNNIATMSDLDLDLVQTDDPAGAHYFNPYVPTFVFVHGWCRGCETKPLTGDPIAIDKDSPLRRSWWEYFGLTTKNNFPDANVLFFNWEAESLSGADNYEKTLAKNEFCSYDLFRQDYFFRQAISSNDIIGWSEEQEIRLCLALVGSLDVPDENVPYVGEKLSLQLADLESILLAKGIDYRNFHLIGSSLGAGVVVNAMHHPNGIRNYPNAVKRLTLLDAPEDLGSEIVAADLNLQPLLTDLAVDYLLSQNLYIENYIANDELFVYQEGIPYKYVDNFYLNGQAHATGTVDGDKAKDDITDYKNGNGVIQWYAATIDPRTILSGREIIESTSREIDTLNALSVGFNYQYNIDTNVTLETQVGYLGCEDRQFVLLPESTLNADCIKRNVEKSISNISQYIKTKGYLQATSPWYVDGTAGMDKSTGEEIYTITTNSPSFIHKKVDLSGMSSFSLEYMTDNIGDDDYFIIAIDDEIIYQRQGIHLVKNEWLSTGRIDISSHAEPDKTISIGVHSDESGHEIQVKNIQTHYIDPNAGDITPPVIEHEGTVISEATGDLTPVTLFAEALDDVDGSVPVISSFDGAFSYGSKVITWSAEDSSGNVAHKDQLIIVRDTTPPILSIPDNISSEATGPLTSVYIGNATASDIFSVTITNDAPNNFPIGKTTVTWVAFDENGNKSTATQDVTITYVFGEFGPPLSDGGKYRANRTLPVKFQLFYSDSSPVVDAKVGMSIYRIGEDETLSESIDLSTIEDADTGAYFRYENEQYIYNLSTKGFLPGKYRIEAILSNGQSPFIDMVLK